jgi:hypothetical protein
MFPPGLHWLALPFDRVARFANDVVARVRRRRQPSRRDLLAMSDADFEAFLERRGIAARARAAMAEHEAARD